MTTATDNLYGPSAKRRFMVETRGGAGATAWAISRRYFMRPESAFVCARAVPGSLLFRAAGSGWVRVSHISEVRSDV